VAELALRIDCFSTHLRKA